MPSACKPENEQQRLESLRSYGILDTLPENEYDQIVKLAANISQTPIALVSLVDADRQWFKSKTGIDADSTHRDLAFCAHAILKPQSPLIVSDATLDERFSDNALVLEEPHIRFYAGIPLNTPDGYCLGTLCVIDQTPRQMSANQIESLTILAANVVSLLELRQAKSKLSSVINKLQISNEELAGYAHVASHDLQEPLRTISSFTTLLKKRLGDNLDEECNDFFNYIVSGCDRMQAQISGLLQFSKVDGYQGENELVDCNKLLDEIVSELSVRIEETGADLSWEELPHVYAIPSHLKIVFMNLIANGIKYCLESKPVVRIESEISEEFIKISVIDNGIGIKEEYQQQIFQLFKRLHAHDKFGGAGIGLSISKKIIEGMGGELSLNSTVGKGSTFYFTIPRDDTVQ